jgi:parvulin-like peptidyl-prolyl isomerase
VNIQHDHPAPTSPEGKKPLAPAFSLVSRRSVIVPVLSVLLILVLAVVFFAVQEREPTGTLLATVNGEPIYVEDIEATLAFLPQVYRTEEQRQSLLNQTIEQRLLSQEALRRGITISDVAVQSRIGTILNDTGRSPPELRLILAGHNLTPAQFEQIIRDQLLIEALGQEAVLSRVSVSEREISDYYELYANEFLSPPGGVRVSHILVANESLAWEIIAQLNQGESFRRLAAEYSIDSSRVDGGSLGVIGPLDDIDSSFKNAALGLAENQYTKAPVESQYGYHIILRQFDQPSLQTVRDSIQQALLRRKQALAFASFLEGLRSGAVIKLYTAEGTFTVPQRSPDSVEAFAACIGTKGTLYVASWSAASNDQLALFGDAAALLSVIDCTQSTSRCTSDGVSKYPTWVFDKAKRGSLTFEQLSDVSSCPLPLVLY